MREFEINIEDISPQVTLVTVGGWLDAHTFESMEKAIANLFRDGKVRLAVDLGNVEYISSAGAGVFIGTLTSGRAMGGDIVLMNPTSSVREVFDMLGLSQVFKFAYTHQEAIALLTRKSSGKSGRHVAAKPAKPAKKQPAAKRKTTRKR
jgi:anti-sigma B factor antagonist